MIIKDNFLPKGAFEFIQGYLLSSNIKWTFQTDKVHPSESTDSYQLVHPFYHVYQPKKRTKPVTDDLEYLSTFIFTLNPYIVLKAKANLTPRTAVPDKTDFHTDLGDFLGQKTAIFYLNTNNGYTEFEDGTIVESVANRICIFDGSERHRGVSCTDEKMRVVLNVNYFPYPQISA